MDDLMVKAGELLIQQGPFAIVAAVMLWRDYKRDKRLDTVTDEHINLSKSTVEILTILKERIR